MKTVTVQINQENFTIGEITTKKTIYLNPPVSYRLISIDETNLTAVLEDLTPDA